MPTLVATPCPSGPVVVSTPDGPAVFRVAGTSAVKLPELLDVIQRHRRISERFVLGVDGLHAGQVQHGVEQHGRMADRQDEAVAVGPDRMAGVESQEVLPKQ